jgi:hypothetical protein
VLLTFLHAQYVNTPCSVSLLNAHSHSCDMCTQACGDCTEHGSTQWQCGSPGAGERHLSVRAAGPCGTHQAPQCPPGILIGPTGGCLDEQCVCNAKQSMYALLAPQYRHWRCHPRGPPGGATPAHRPDIPASGPQAALEQQRISSGSGAPEVDIYLVGSRRQ